MSKSLIKRTLLIIFLVLMGYSFLPLIRFWIMPDPVKTVKNAEAVKQLGENKGSYFSFIVFGDNHAGLWFNDAAALKEIWHINREDRFLKVPIDFVLNTGDVSLNGKRKHFENYRKIVDLIKFPVVSAIGNHDDRALFEEFIGDKEFAFADRNSYFIVLDNEEGQLTEEQFFWLEERLKEGKGYAHIFDAA